MSLELLKTRLQYAGGNQEQRMIKGKLESLKKAMLYSYQAATAILSDGREFRCLINPDKLKEKYDDKIISIPFEDICIGRIIEQINEETGEIIKVEEKAERKGTTTQGIETTGMKVGDVFTWKETNTDWLVYLQRLEEDAYFRAEIRRCDYEIEINGNKYKVYARKPDLDTISWHTKQNISWNDIDYNVILYITKNEETDNYFHRFMTIELNGKPWEVQVVDNISTEGLILVGIKETFQNTIKNERIEEIKKEQEDAESKPLPQILGDTIVYPYSTKEYHIDNFSGGVWKLSNKKARIDSQTETDVKITFITGKSGNVDLIYKRENEEDIVLNITIESL